MVTGAQISEYKSKLLDELPSSLFAKHSKVLLTDDAKKIKATPTQVQALPTAAWQARRTLSSINICNMHIRVRP